MNSGRSAVLMTVFILVCAVIARPVQAATTFYVAPDGNDNWSGALQEPNGSGDDGPFATLGRARQAARQRIREGLESDVIVYVRGGTYHVTKPVVFGIADSPGDRYSVTYAAYPGEEPVFTAGVPVEGWRKLTASEVPEGLTGEARDHVWVTGITKDSAIPRKFYTLYNGNKRLPRARGDSFEPADNKGDLTTFRFPQGTLRNWPNLDDVELVVRPLHPWVMNILPLESVDEASRTATTSIPATYPIRPVSKWGVPPEDRGKSIRVENVPEALDTPGEWMLNSRERKLYLWPKSGEPGDDIRAPATREMIRVEGDMEQGRTVRNLTFRGLTFTQGERATWTSEDAGLQHDWEMYDKDNTLLRLRGAEDCVVEDCRFVNSAGTGVRLDLHCQGNRVVGCEFAHLGGTGVVLCGYGPGTKDVNHHNAILDNDIHHCGEVYWHCGGIFVWQSGHNRIAHNAVHDMPYSGVVVSGVRPHFFKVEDRRECSRTIRWDEVGGVGQKPYSEIMTYLHSRHNVLEYNEVYHTMQRLGDGNGIYVSGTGPGNVLRRNYLHDVLGYASRGAIRLDNAQNQTLVTENVIRHCVYAGILLKGVNRLEGNVIVDMASRSQPGGHEVETCGHIVLRRDSLSPRCEGSRIERNLFYHTGGPERFYGLRRGGPLTGLVVDHNLYYSTAGLEWVRNLLDEHRADGLDAHSRAAEPGLVNAEAGDFTLKPGAAAAELGICPFDIKRAGPRQ